MFWREIWKFVAEKTQKFCTALACLEEMPSHWAKACNFCSYKSRRKRHKRACRMVASMIGFHFSFIHLSSEPKKTKVSNLPVTLKRVSLAACSFLRARGFMCSAHCEGCCGGGWLRSVLSPAMFSAKECGKVGRCGPQNCQRRWFGLRNSKNHHIPFRQPKDTNDFAFRLAHFFGDTCHCV